MCRPGTGNPDLEPAGRRFIIREIPPRAAPAQGARLSENAAIANEQKVYDVVDELEKIAAPHRGTISQAALNYLLGKPGVSSVVVGIRTPEQMADNLKTTEWEMTPDEISRLDKLTKPAPVYPYDFQAHYPPE